MHKKTGRILTDIRSISMIALGLCFLAVAVISCQTAETSEKTEDKQVSSEPEVSHDVKKKTIVFFGNSLTAGYGLKETESFPSLIQDRLDSLDLPYTAINAGLSGETTAGGNRRIDWVLKQPMDIFFLELGGNDMLRGTPIEETEKNLREIVQKVREAHPKIPIILAGMLAPPNLGKKYTDAFANIYPSLAKELNLILIPFFLKDVGGIPTLNQPDGIHPTAEGQRIVAGNVWQYLEPVLK